MGFEVETNSKDEELLNDEDLMNDTEAIRKVFLTAILMDRLSSRAVLRCRVSGRSSS